MTELTNTVVKRTQRPPCPSTLIAIATLPTRFVDLPSKHQTWIAYPWPVGSGSYDLVDELGAPGVAPGTCPLRRGDYLQSLDLERRGYIPQSSCEGRMRIAYCMLSTRYGNEHADAIAETRMG